MGGTCDVRLTVVRNGHCHPKHYISNSASNLGNGMNTTIFPVSM